MIKLSILDNIYKYIGDSGLDHPNLHFPNMHNFLNNGKQPAWSDSTASSLNSNTSSGVEDSINQIILTTEESIASESSKSVDVTGINVDDDDNTSASIASDVYGYYNVP